MDHPSPGTVVAPFPFALNYTTDRKINSNLTETQTEMQTETEPIFLHILCCNYIGAKAKVKATSLGMDT